MSDEEKEYDFDNTTITTQEKEIKEEVIKEEVIKEEVIKEEVIKEEIIKEEEEEEDEEFQDNLRDVFGSESEEEKDNGIQKLEVPRFKTPNSESKKYYFRLPSSLNVVFAPFDPKTYTLEAQDGNHENTIRWRTKDEEKESNAKILKWSDGSMQLKVGNTFFDITEQPVKNNHLFLKQSNRNIFCQGVFDHKWNLKPTITTQHIQQKITSKKVSSLDMKGIKLTEAKEDPEFRERKLIENQSSKLREKQKKKLKDVDAFGPTDSIKEMKKESRKKEEFY